MRITASASVEDLQARALALWRRGLSVIPVPLPDGTQLGKSPEIRWKPYQERLPSEAEILRWFQRPQNLAIVTGQVSGVVVIDCDSPQALTWVTQRLPYSPWQTQTSRGFHVYYRHPGVPVRNRAGLATGTTRLNIDVRGDGGCVIAAGSRHHTGSWYVEAGDWQSPREALPAFNPAWLASAVQASGAVRQPRTGRDGAPLVERARRYLAKIPRPEIGAGSDQVTLYAAARLVRGYALDTGTAVDLLEEWAGGRPGWDRQWLGLKVANAARYGREPLGGLR